MADTRNIKVSLRTSSCKYASRKYASRPHFSVHGVQEEWICHLGGQQHQSEQRRKVSNAEPTRSTPAAVRGALPTPSPDKARPLLALFVECKKADAMVDKTSWSNPSYHAKQDALYSSVPLQDCQEVVRPCSPCSSQDPSGFSDDMNEDRK